MKFSTVLLTALLAALFAMGPGDVSDQPPGYTPEDGARNLRTIPPEPPSTPVELGDRAPDFSFQAEDNRWRRLHDLLGQGPVFLVFGAEPEVLTAIEREREAILKLGVVPVALLDLKGRNAWALAKRLGLHYVVIPDSRRVIAGQFNAVEAGGQRTVPAWFVVDRSGNVRALRRGSLPRKGYPSRIANALALPDPASGIPAETRR